MSVPDLPAPDHPGLPDQRIRALALAIIRRGDCVLVLVGRDPLHGDEFHRPLGGGIEFGESGEEAVRRELLEELSAEIEVVGYLGTLENRFTYGGVPGHELIRLYEAKLVDRALNESDDVVAIEGDTQFPVRWLPLQEVRAGTAVLYPDNLLDLLDS